MTTLLFLFAIALGFAIQTPLTQAQVEPSAKDRALAFIENVIQPDIPLYNVTLLNDVVGQPLIWPSETQESVTYHLAEKSNGMGPDINCFFENGSLTMVQLGVDQTFTHSPNADESQLLVYSNPSTNLTEQTKGLLERYQAYVGDNLQDMINALTNADVTQNQTKTVGDIKLTTETTSVETDVSVKHTYNGTDYTGVSFAFRSGQFYIFSEDFSRWTIGNTDVNVNQTQAIGIARQYMQTYSYTLEDGTVVNQFNITSITAGLNTYPRDNTTTIYPYWSIQVNLNDTYPPNCYAISMGIWADSGTVIFAQPLFVGGGILSTASSAPTAAATSTPIQSRVAGGVSPIELIITVCIVASAIAVTTAVAFKKHSKPEPF